MEKIKRDTNKVLMQKVFELVQNNGCYEKASEIMDYFLPENFQVEELSNYEFDFSGRVAFGGSEGIYLSCYIEGNFTEGTSPKERKYLKCGTFKTLRTDLEAMKIMGELSGALIYFASEYINSELDRYTPTEK